MNEHRGRCVGVCALAIFGFFVAALLPSTSAAQALPSGWTASNIGNPILAGSAVYSSSVFSVTGAGTSIWGSKDQFMFVQKQITGDTTIVVRVSGLVGPIGWSSAGVMLRESLSADSKNATALVSVTDGVNFQWRSTTGGSSLSKWSGAGKAPVWLKLQRQGSTFTAFRSPDGVTWTNISSTTVSMSATLYAGLALVSYKADSLAMATFSNVSVGGQAPVPPTAPPPPPTPVPNKAPTVSLTSPANGTSYVPPATINMAATASDSDGSITRVDFYSGSTLIGSDASSPYSFSWTNVPAGSYALSAVARDNAGASTTSSVSTISVKLTSPNKPPFVSMTAPLSGATFVAPASIALAATASDSDGTVSRVDFYNGSTLMGTDTTSPYAYSWTNVPAGSYALSAVARDNAGASTTSAVSTVTVTSSSSNKPPFVSMTAPLPGTTFVAPASITLAATASDSDGTVSRVEFYNGTTLIGSDTTSPYGITWSNVAVGKYSLTAVARDNVGGTTVSGAINVLAVSAQMPKRLLFTPSSNYASAVSSNLLEIFAAGSNPATAAPIATLNLGKPPVVNGQCSVDIAQTIYNLPAGSYIATVTAVGSGGSAQSAPSPTFTR